MSNHWGCWRERGAALIELALAIPLIIMLVVGMVSAGFAYNHQLAMTHASRESGRYAATLPVTNFGTIDAWLAEVVTQTINDSTGSLGAGIPGVYVCVAYVHPMGMVTSDQTHRLIFDELGFGSTEPDMDCFSDGRPGSERRVQIEVRREVDFNVVFFSPTLTLDAEAVNRFEAGLGF